MLIKILLVKLWMLEIKSLIFTFINTLQNYVKCKMKKKSQIHLTKNY